MSTPATFASALDTLAACDAAEKRASDECRAAIAEAIAVCDRLSPPRPDDLGETYDQFCARQDAEEADRNEAAEVQRDLDADVRHYLRT